MGKDKTNYEEIIRRIESGLTGDPQKDSKYLDEQCGNYCRHENSNEILGAIREIRVKMRSSDYKNQSGQGPPATGAERIIKEIESGLTGDPIKDDRFLDEQSGKYSKHELSNDIFAAIRRMRADISSQKKKNETARPIEGSSKEKPPENTQPRIFGDYIIDTKIIEESNKSREFEGYADTSDEFCPITENKPSTEYEGIINTIRSGMTGNPDKDKRYLEKQSKKYKNHELSDEILPAIGQMVEVTKRAECDNIIKEIGAGRPENPKKDRTYLEKQRKRYSDHEYSAQIDYAIGLMMYSQQPNKGKK
jgi:hypothetical protein